MWETHALVFAQASSTPKPVKLGFDQTYKFEQNSRAVRREGSKLGNMSEAFLRNENGQFVRFRRK